MSRILCYSLFIIFLFKQCYAAVTPVRYCVAYGDLGSRLSVPQEDLEDDFEEDNLDDSNDIESTPESINITVGNVLCEKNFNRCYAVWKMDENGTLLVVGQGCWHNNDRVEQCNQTTCISEKPISGGTSHHFCCCANDLCNSNFTVIKTLPDSLVASTSPIEVWANGNLPVMWIFLTISTIIIFGLLVLLIRKTRPKPEPELSPLAPSSGPGYSSNMQNVDNLKLCAMIGQGKYGTVWKGIVNEQAIAVKIFPGQHKQYFLNERDIYTIPLMDSPSLLSYFGCDQRRTMDDNIEYLLVLSLAPLGCLQDWLADNTTSFVTFCDMAKSVTRGLSHLHTQIKKGEFIKPSICHRDLNSRNVLVKSDLSLCICDFGFAVKTFGPSYEYKGEMALAETKSINEVGTLRYMAPEILEGAVNLRDCEAALKQIDVYALGLIIWELCTRCQDLYPIGQNPPSYKAPYEAETGKNPSFEQMQVLVSRHKARPLFPSGWGGGAAAKIARDTCEDCWDHDSEARLTALCVEERLQELSTFRPRSYIARVSTPPINTNNLLAPTLSPNSDENIFIYSVNSTNIITTPPNQNLPNSNRNNINDLTGETIISFSPENNVPIKNFEIFSQQIQAFQGRNPCLERNLAPINTQTQILVEKSKKHSFLKMGEEGKFSTLDNDVGVEDLMPTTSYPPILSDENNMGEGFPKQNNIDKKLNGWNGIRALIQKKLFKHSELLNEHDEKSNLVDKKILKVSLENPNSVTTPTKNIRVNLVDTAKNQNGVAQAQIQLESATRPNNLDIASLKIKYSYANDINKSSSPLRIFDNNENSNLIINMANTDEGDINNLQSQKYKRLPGGNQKFTVINSSPKYYSPRIVVSKSANAVKNINLDLLNEKQIKRQRSLEVFREVFNTKGSCERLRDPSQRVKTPGDVPKSVRKVRASKTLSLYDDRMMDSNIGNTL